MKKYLVFTPMVISFCVLFGLAIYNSLYEKKKPSDFVSLEQGKAAKIKFDDHSYVIWQKNFSDCIVHDPGCKCLEGKK